MELNLPGETDVNRNTLYMVPIGKVAILPEARATSISKLRKEYEHNCLQHARKAVTLSASSIDLNRLAVGSGRVGPSVGSPRVGSGFHILLVYLYTNNNIKPDPQALYCNPT